MIVRDPSRTLLQHVWTEGKIDNYCASDSNRYSSYALFHWRSSAFFAYSTTLPVIHALHMPFAVNSRTSRDFQYSSLKFFPHLDNFSIFLK